MNKKFLSAILFGALMVTSTGTFVSCKDYDDDIEDLQTQIKANASAIAELKALIGNGDYVTSVSVSGQNLVVNTKNNSTTVALPECDDEVGSYCEVKGGVLYIDGEATEIKVCETPVVEEGEFLPAVKIVNGEWAVLQEDKTYLSTGYAASSVTVVENTKGGYTLTVKDAEGTETVVELPATKVITDLKATTIAGGKMGDAKVTLYYGKKITDNDGLTFNGKTYAKGTYLISQNSPLSVIVNPLDADATKYSFKLEDTKGNAPIVVSDIKQNTSKKALSRAETANQGVWDMTLSFADADNVDVSGTYALTTETVNGVVSSLYDVEVTAEQVSSVGVFDEIKAVEGKCGENIDIAKYFYEHDLGKYIVDSYFELTDKTAANNEDVTLNGNIITTTRNETFTFEEVKGYFLFVDGEKAEVRINVTFKQVAPTASLADIEWTINADNKTVYLPLSSIQSQLAGTSDTSLPAISLVSSTWADGVALNDRSVLVNGVNYGKADDSSATEDKEFNSEWITSLSTQLYSVNAAGTAYEKATTVQKDMYALFTFNENTAFPGEYIVNVGFRKNGATTGDYVFVVPVKVTIKAPAQTIVKYDNYFSGNNAVAYGTADGTSTEYDLNDLFKTTGLTYTETKVVKTASPLAYYKTWLQDDGHTINVPVYLYGTNVDNTVTVGSTHEYTASIVPFDNAHIQQTEYTFNLTVKSAINEGEFSSEASKTIATSEPVEFAVTDFTAKDVYGDVFYIANTYKYNSTDKAYTSDTENTTDGRITSVEISAADENAANYLDFDAEFSYTSGKATDTFKVARKSGLTQLVSDTECKLDVTILDKWGVKTTTTVTVILKKFGN